MQRQTGGRLRAILVLAFSLMAAGFASAIVLRVLKQKEDELAKASRPPQTVDVVVATRELFTGVVIADADVAVRALVPENVPKETTFSTTDQVVGRTPRERILPNEIVRSERLAVKDAGIGLNAIITPGKRAMSVAVDAETGVAGFINPGNYVDVVVTIRPDDKSGGGKWTSKAFLQGVKVLAVGRNLGAGEEDPAKQKAMAREKPTVTLELSLEEAEEMALSASKGEIRLALRNDTDITQVLTNGAQANQLIGWEAEGKKPPPAVSTDGSKGPSSEVIQGSTVETYTFGTDGEKKITTTRKDGRR